MTSLTQTTTFSSLSDVAVGNLQTPTPEQVQVLERMKQGLSDTPDGNGSFVPAGFPPNDYQLAFFEHLIGTTFNLGLDAKAGTGKTSTIEAAVRLIKVLTGKKALFLAFNRTIAAELKKRFAEAGYKVDVATVHSAGFRAVKFALKQKAKANGMSATELKNLQLVDLDSSYFKMYVRTNLQTQYKDEEGEEKFNYDELVEKFSHLEEFDAYQYTRTIIRLAELGRMFLTSKEEGLTELVGKYALDLQADEVAQAAKFIKEYTLEFFNYMPSKGSTVKIDYTDMIWLPNVGAAMKNWRFQTYDFVFVDEAQDLSNAQRSLVTKFVKPSGGRLIFVGDPNQAIYGFAGADSQSYEKLTTLPNVKVLPLNLCYRCGSEIINVAKRFVPSIEAHNSTGKGEVRKGLVSEIKRGDLIIGRMTAPLVSLCMFFIRNKIQATVLGSNIGENLISTIRSARKRNVSDLMEKLWAKYDKTCERLVAMNKADDIEDAMNHPTAATLHDTIETIQVIASESAVKTVQALINEVKRIFSEQEAPITLMTAHRSKGLESDNVHILDWEDTFPHPMAKTPDERQQETNLQYVAVTRAKKKLSFIYTPEFWDDVKAPKI